MIFLHCPVATTISWNHTEICTKLWNFKVLFDSTSSTVFQLEITSLCTCPMKLHIILLVACSRSLNVGWIARALPIGRLSLTWCAIQHIWSLINNNFDWVITCLRCMLFKKSTRGTWYKLTFSLFNTELNIFILEKLSSRTSTDIQNRRAFFSFLSLMSVSGRFFSAPAPSLSLSLLCSLWLAFY